MKKEALKTPLTTALEQTKNGEFVSLTMQLQQHRLLKYWSDHKAEYYYQLQRKLGDDKDWHYQAEGNHKWAKRISKHYSIAVPKKVIY